MSLLEGQLFTKKSGLPGAGKGLFTKKAIPKGTHIVEYKGKITSWKDANHAKGFNGYIYYITRNHVIDALKYPKALARYANDAKGLSRLHGLLNNSRYEEVKGKVFITAVKHIPAGGEILVQYGKEYWDVIRQNYRELDAANKTLVRPRV